MMGRTDQELRDMLDRISTERATMKPGEYPEEKPVPATPAPDGMDVVAWDKLRKLIGEYFDLGYAEGVVQRDADTMAGDAQRTLAEIETIISQAQSLVAELRADNDSLLAAADADAFVIGNLQAQVKRLTEEKEALRDSFRDKVALGASEDEILRFRDSYPNPAGGPKVFYRYTIEQARYRYADAVLAARQALSGSEKE